MSNATIVLLVDLITLGFRNAHHGQRGVPFHGKAKQATPDAVAYVALINVPLLFQRFAFEDVINVLADFEDAIGVNTQHACESARGAAIIKRLSRVIEELDPTVPVVLGPAGQVSP